MKLIQCAALFAIAMPAFLTVSLRADCIPVKVVVITTFQSGKDNDPTGGEFGNWVLNLPLSETIPFPQGYHHLRYNPELQVLGIVTGEGKSHAAASIMGLGMDPRFDLSKAYWIIAAIAGVDPNKASVASTAWAKYVVDGDLAYEIDARQIPQGWSTGYVPFGRSMPYQGPSQPFNPNGVQQVFQLNASLADWAFELTKNIHLPDDSTLRKLRAGYPNYPIALKPPFVLQGDDLAADHFWIGDLLNTWAENWTSYWTANQGSFAMSDFEDTGVGLALQFLSQVNRADKNRLLVLRSASDYTVQAEGQTPAQLLANDVSGGLSGFVEALSNVYQVGSTVVKEISSNWDTYENHIPSPASLGARQRLRQSNRASRIADNRAKRMTDDK
jgi:purine nucleoside permease